MKQPKFVKFEKPCNQPTKPTRNRLTDTENKWAVTTGKLAWGRVTQVKGINRYKPPVKK